ncbi:hypothetical protein [Ferrimonas balearica]|uniref:hypothetical protein n=1 Tax=Ferrimonas balearica TaxID=44012 RepID=UPI001C99523C|nr:hypothetical protein [Ferrimonas balearica]MBY5922978.1 hypothetical protein [Ferrimonas balearica]MBY5997645.1 hypothetical protein [Ferrimonas balearica]
MLRTITAVAILMSLAACGSSDDHSARTQAQTNITSAEQSAAPVTSMTQCQPDEIAVDFGCLPLEPNLAQLADSFDWRAEDLAATCLDPELPAISCELRYSDDATPHDVAVISGELAVDQAHNNGSGSLNFVVSKDDESNETTITLENHTWDAPQSCEAAHMNCESVFTMVKSNGDSEELGRIDTNGTLTLKVDDAMADKMRGTVRLEVNHYEAGALYSTDAFITPRAEFVAAFSRMRQQPDNQIERELAD